MKKLFLFLAMASTTMFVSCGSDDSDPATEPIVEQPTAITLTASASTVQVGTAVTFTVKNNLVPVVDVTSTSTFTANNVAFTGGVFTPTEAGTFTIVAKNGTLTSAPFVLTVTPAPLDPQGKFTFNGTDYSLDNMFFVGHGDSTSGQFYLIDNDPSEEVEELGTLWIGVIFNGAEEDIADATHYMEVQFFLPAIVDAEGTPTGINWPGEAAATAYSVYAEENLVPFNLDGVTQGAVTFDAFDYPQEGVKTNAFSSTFGDGTTNLFSHEYDGTFSGIYLVDLSGKPAAKGVRTGKTISASNFVNLKDVKKTFAKSAKIKSFKSIR